MALEPLSGARNEARLLYRLILVLEIGDLSEEDEEEVCSCDPLCHSGQLEPAVAREQGAGKTEEGAPRCL